MILNITQRFNFFPDFIYAVITFVLFQLGGESTMAVEEVLDLDEGALAIEGDLELDMEVSLIKVFNDSLI